MGKKIAVKKKNYHQILFSDSQIYKIYLKALPLRKHIFYFLKK